MPGAARRRGMPGQGGGAGRAERDRLRWAGVAGEPALVPWGVPTLRRSRRPRRRDGSDWSGLLDGGGDDLLGAVVLVVAAVLLVVLLVLFAPLLLALLLFVVETLVFLLAALATLLGAVVLRRPWRIVAETPGPPPEHREVRVHGLRTSRRALEDLCRQLRT
jgi:hypothetical protein